jgi:transcriptional regulator with XRE-family HTH domain
LSHKEAAREIGVNLETLARWERGEREPTDVFRTRVDRFLDVLEPKRSKSLPAEDCWPGSLARDGFAESAPQSSRAGGKNIA